MLTISVSVLAGIAAWIAAGTLNYFWFNRFFEAKRGEPRMDRDLVVALGPLGTLMLFLCATLKGYLDLCEWLAGRLFGASNALLVLAIVVPWVGSGTANYIWFNRLFDSNGEPRMDRDLLVAMGPIGSFMLLLCAGMDCLLKLCARLSRASS